MEEQNVGVGYTQEYYDNYDLGEGGVVNYFESDLLRNTLASFAKNITNDLHPTTVLDAGCAMGVLVSEFRKLGVEAYGIDFSEYAIENADPIARPYCVQGSLADPIPESLNRRYDLITCFEVLEHMSEEEGLKAIENLTKLSDTIIFCSTPDDFEDPTHINVRERYYWAQCFAKFGFYDDLFFRPTYVTPYAVCYRKMNDWLDQVKRYEQYVKAMDQSLKESEEKLHRLEAEGLYHNTITVFFEDNGGYTSENSAGFEVMVPKTEQLSFQWKKDISVPKGCAKIRLDPCENAYCVLSYFRVVFGGHHLAYKPINGYTAGDLVLFPTEDPQLEIELSDTNGGILHIDMQMRLYDVRDLTLDTVSRQLEEMRESIVVKDNLLAEQEQKHAQEIAGIIEAKNTEIEELNSKYELEITEINETKNTEIEELNNKYKLEIAGINETKNTEIEELNSKYELEIAEINETKNTEIEELNNKYKLEIAGINETKNTEIEELNNKYKLEIAGINETKNTEIEELNSKYELEIAEINETKNTEIEELSNKYELEITKINAVVNEKDNYIGQVVTLCNERLAQIESLNASVNGLQNANNQLNTRCTIAEQNYAIVSSSFCWKITAPVRFVLDGMKKIAKRNDSLYLTLKSLKWTLRFGPKKSKEMMKAFLFERYRLKAATSWPSEEELAAQKNTKFDRDVKFSVLVPLYNTPLNFLSEMIESVQAQSYQNWELCLADGSDAEHEDVGKTCKKYAKKDKRIKYKKLEKNLGISGNTNACIEMSTGDYIALLDHDDILHPSALYEVMKAICEKKADFIYTDETTFESPDKNRLITTHFKPDFAPDNLLANNYICHFSAFSSDLLQKTGGFRSEYDGSQDHDLILRLTNAAECIVHIPKVLYWWRSHPQSVAQDIGAKQYAVDAAKRAVQNFLWDYKHVKVDVLSTRAFPTIFQIVYPIKDRSRISIVIPNKDHINDLKRCIDSILEKTTYENYEIVIVENNSESQEIFDYYNYLRENERIRVLNYQGSFNYSKINNWAVKQCRGDYIVLLNNVTEIITPEWLENMLMYAQRKDVGAVGAKLYFPDGRIQHAGIVIKLGADRIAGHSHYGVNRDNLGYMGRLCYAQDVSAVTAACLMISRKKFKEVDGLDEDFVVAFNDVDFCLKLRKNGYLNIFTPFTELYHYESASRGLETGEKRDRFKKECEIFRNKWKDILETGDPYYNPNLSLDSSLFETAK